MTDLPLDQTIASLKDEIQIRLDGVNMRFDSMDKAIAIVKEDAVRVPTLLDRAIANLHEIVHNEIAITAGLIDKSNEVREERFRAIQMQFTSLMQATEKLDLARQTAIAKSEASTAEAIKTLTATFQQQFTSATDRFNDLKSRLDRGEGGRDNTSAAWGYLLTAAGVAIPLVSLLVLAMNK